MNAHGHAPTANAPRDLLDRMPPANVEAERNVLGAALIDPACFDDLAVALRSGDFYDAANGRIFESLLQLAAAGKPIDVALLVDALKRDGHYDAVGGLAYLGGLVHGVPHAVNAPHYAEIVRQHALRRALIQASAENAREAYDLSQDSRRVIEAAESRIFAISDRHTNVASRSAADLLREAMDRINNRAQGGGGITGLSTGFVEFDALTGGLSAGQLVLVAARPGMGKSAFGLNVAERVALTAGVGVLIVSLEMTALELSERMLCSVASVNGMRVRDGTLQAGDRSRLVKAAAEISNAPLWIDDAPSRTAMEIGALARRHKSRDDIGLLVIDYVQLVEPDDPRDTRQEQVAKIARRIKTIAREIEIPVICLAQLNRQTEAARDNRPRLSHLRESGALEQDADVVMFLHREEYYAQTDADRKAVAGKAELIVAKQRNGPTGNVPLTWLPATARFENAADERFTDEGSSRPPATEPEPPSEYERSSYSRRKDLF